MVIYLKSVFGIPRSTAYYTIFQASKFEMRSTTRILLSASALLGASFVNGLAEEVFAAIDKQDDGLRTVNKEVNKHSKARMSTES